MDIKNRGFALVELLVATGVVVLVMVAVASGVTTALKNSRYSKEKTESARLAQEVVEWLRSQRAVLGWEVFYDAIESDNPPTSSGSTEVIYCLGWLPSESNGFIDLKSAKDTQSCPAISGTDFVRVLKLTLPDNVSRNRVQIEIDINWNDGSGLRNTKVTSTLTKWR